MEFGEHWLQRLSLVLVRGQGDLVLEAAGYAHLGNMVPQIEIGPAVIVVPAVETTSVACRSALRSQPLHSGVLLRACFDGAHSLILGGSFASRSYEHTLRMLPATSVAKRVQQAMDLLQTGAMQFADVHGTGASVTFTERDGTFEVEIKRGDDDDATFLYHAKFTTEY